MNWLEEDAINEPLIFEHSADVLERHLCYVGKAIKAVSAMARADEKEGLVAQYTTTSPGPPIRKRTNDGSIKMLNSVTLSLSHHSGLNRAIDLGAQQIYFLPGIKEFNVSAGFPTKIPSSWIGFDPSSLTRSNNSPMEYQVAYDDYCHCPATDGMFLVRPRNTLLTLLFFLKKLATTPEYFPIETAAQLFNLDPACHSSPTIPLHGLSDEQSYCINTHLNRTLTLIWGPPGTGKSGVLRSLISVNLQAGKRVLLTAAANDAIDSVAERIQNAMYDGKDSFLADAIKNKLIMRVGRSGDPARVRLYSDLAERKCTEQDSPPLGILSTLFRVFSSETINLYDSVLIEEAGMLSPPIIYAAACLSMDRLVICGDPRQLPPVFEGKIKHIGKEAVTEWTTDIFKHIGIQLTTPDPRICALTTQYRFTPDILAYINEADLYPSYCCPIPPRPLTAEEQRALECQPCPGKSVVVIDTSDMESLRESKNSNTSHANLVCALASGYKRKSHIQNIGITTPYKEQASIFALWTKKNRYSSIAAATVHSFQGSERCLMIYDTVEGFGPHDYRHFLTDEAINPRAINLHNVAASRAKAKLIFIINRRYVRSSLSPGCFLQRVLDRAEKEKCLISAADALTSVGVSLDDALPLKKIPFLKAPSLLSPDQFYDQLKKDASIVTSHITIASSLLDSVYLCSYIKMLKNTMLERNASLVLYVSLNISSKVKGLISTACKENEWLVVKSIKKFKLFPTFVQIDSDVSYKFESDSESCAPLAGILPGKIIRIVE